MNQRRNRKKVTAGHKAAIGALSVLGLIAGWNVVGRSEHDAGADDETAANATTSGIATVTTTTVTPQPVAPVATPWPTIAPLSISPRLQTRALPTLVAVALPQEQSGAAASANGGSVSSAIAAPSLMALPTLAPLPTMPEYVAPPPPPPPQVAAAPPPLPPPPPSGGGNNVSDGS